MSYFDSMIYGIGTDIVSIQRIAHIMARTCGRFATKILGKEELEKYHLWQVRSMRRALAFLATRFAAKEACAKAIGLGMHSPMGWHAIQTLNAPNGQPFIVANTLLRNWLNRHHLHIYVSLSDERDYAQAWVVADYVKPLPK